MKRVFLFPLLSICILQASSQLTNPSSSFTSSGNLSFIDGNEEGSGSSTQTDPGSSRMAAAVFKSQDYCRAELKDFEFDARFVIVSATVYFSGAGFKNVEKGSISSSSLQPIKGQMERCQPGSVIIFDEVKVMGPDNKLRTIPGLSLVLY
jgi:hypothetical protein